jgi:hypothetical protein
MGGAGRNLVLFKIKWLTEDEQGPAILRHEAITQEYKENPRLARTVDDSETTLPSRRLTRLHTPGTRQLRIRFIPRGDRLGVGQFGTVLKAIDVDTAEIMAVKILHRPEGASTEDEWRQSVLRTLKREVEILSQLNHVSNPQILMRAKLTHF